MGLKRSNNFQFVLIYMALLLEYCSTLGDNYIRIMRNTRLKGEYTYLTLERWTIAYCLIECSNDKAECASINYNQVEQICELNRFVELNGEKSGEGKLKSQPGWTFYQKDSNVRMPHFIILREETQPQKNRLIESIAVQKISWKLSFDMVLLHGDNSNYKNVFHFTTGGNSGEHGYRTPAMWVKHQFLLIAFNTDVDSNTVHLETIPLNKKINVKIEQVLLSQTPTVRIFIDEKMVPQVSHNWTTLFRNVKFFLSDGFYDPAPVKLWNLRYT